MRLNRCVFTVCCAACDTQAEWTPFQTHYYSENLVAPGIEPGTSVSVARNSDHYTTEAVTA